MVIAKEIMGVIGCRCWEQVKDMGKIEKEGWQLLMKGIEQIEEGLDMIKFGLELQKKAANFFIKKVEEEKKD